MMQDSKPQDTCPVCSKAFADKDAIIKVWRWDAKAGETGDVELVHLDCLLRQPPKKHRDVSADKAKAEELANYLDQGGVPVQNRKRPR
jgi:hypothetical protein